MEGRRLVVYLRKDNRITDMKLSVNQPTLSGKVAPFCKNWAIVSFTLTLQKMRNIISGKFFSKFQQIYLKF